LQVGLPGQQVGEAAGDPPAPGVFRETRPSSNGFWAEDSYESRPTEKRAGQPCFAGLSAARNPGAAR